LWNFWWTPNALSICRNWLLPNRGVFNYSKAYRRSTNYTGTGPWLQLH
jgi:hypothetical protein